MVGIDEVARRAGVSTATVSRALSGRGTVSAATKLRVQDAADSLGYVVSAPASSLASGRSRNIGLLVPFLDRWFFSTVLAGATAELMRHGYDVTLYALTADADLRARVFDTLLRRRRVDAVIAVSINLGEAEVERLAELDLPVIAIGGSDPRMTTLRIDDVAVARLATDHLLSLGHRRIAHIGANPEFDIDFHIPTQRRQGFEQALRAAGIAITQAMYEPADFTIAGGFRAAKQILGRPGVRPTAVFAASDEMAIGALLAARELGYSVPGDLSLVGVDGHDLGGFFGLTTVDQFPERQGRHAAMAALSALGEAGKAGPTARGSGEASSGEAVSGEAGSGEAGSGDDTLELPFELIVRATTARLPV